jgi:hypothetical protein
MGLEAMSSGMIWENIQQETKNTEDRPVDWHCACHCALCNQAGKVLLVTEEILKDSVVDSMWIGK